MPDPFTGRTLAHYRIAQRLGSGGMGVVYSALDLRLDRRVAVKILSGADAGRDRLLHEARAASALTHPHVAAIHAVEEVQAEGVAFIVMEYVEGEPLSAIVARGPLDQAALVRTWPGRARASRSAAATRSGRATYAQWHGRGVRRLSGRYSHLCAYRARGAQAAAGITTDAQGRFSFRVFEGLTYTVRAHYDVPGDPQSQVQTSEAVKIAGPPAPIRLVLSPR